MPAVRTDLTGNAECAWDEFDPEWYVDHNYRTVREDDRRILQQVRDFFATTDRPLGRGIDVGAGPNLYPALAMLPLCHEVTLWERSRSNVAWLNREVERFSQSWDAFWNVLLSRPRYADLDDPRQALRERARVWNGDIFRLGRRQWDVGTMFFVAESITANRGEFQRAVERFIRALKPGAPFAAAFMKNSTGYAVSGHRFPAVAVNERDVEQCLSSLDCQALKISPIPSVTPLRAGYDGMILALGWAGNPKG
jgi:hypothetical protein